MSGGGYWGHCDTQNCPLDDQGQGIQQQQQQQQEEQNPPQIASQLQQAVIDGGDDDEGFEACVNSAGKSGRCRPASLCVGESFVLYSFTYRD